MLTGTFIVNNYRQALLIIEENTPIIEATCTRLNIVEADFNKFLQEERVYISSLKAERLDNPLHVTYVSALKDQALRK